MDGEPGHGRGGGSGGIVPASSGDVPFCALLLVMGAAARIPVENTLCSACKLSERIACHLSRCSSEEKPEFN